jgi:adenylate kinase
VILGRQGAGKGTQALRLSRHYVIPHISTGDILRSAVKQGTEFGRKAQEYMDAGELLPDDIISGVVSERLEHDDTARGFVLDGFPRTVHQAEALEEMTRPRGIDLAIDLDVPEEIVLQRLASRRVCVECGTNYSTTTPHAEDWVCEVCGGKVILRADDTEVAIRRRLALYEEETAPLISWYLERDELVIVDGMGAPDAVTARLIRAVERRRQPA